MPEILERVLERLNEDFLAAVPKAVIVIVLLVLGWIVAIVARRTVRFLVQKSGLEALAEKAGVAKILDKVGIKRGAAHVAGALAYGVVMLVTLMVAAEASGLQSLANAMNAIIAYVPRAITAAIILLMGVWASSFVGGLATRVGSNRDDVDAPSTIGKIVEYGVLTLAAVLAATQAGVETELLTYLVVVVVGVTVGSVAISFALSARPAFASMVAKHYYEKAVRPGDLIEVGGHRGTVVRYNRVAVVIRTESGEKLIPCRMLLEDVVSLED